MELRHRLAINRELQMIELKREINELAEASGKTRPYDLSALEPNIGKSDGLAS